MIKQSLLILALILISGCQHKNITIPNGDTNSSEKEYTVFFKKYDSLVNSYADENAFEKQIKLFGINDKSIISKNKWVKHTGCDDVSRSNELPLLRSLCLIQSDIKKINTYLES